MAPCFDDYGRLLAAFFLLMALPSTATAQAVAPHVRTFEFTYQTTVPVPAAGTRQLELWLPIAHSDASQEIKVLRIEAPTQARLTTGQYGNQQLYLRMPSPAAPLTVAVHYQVTRREHHTALATAAVRVPISDPDSARWLAADHLVPLDNQIRLWAQQVVGAAHATTPLAKARAIYNHVVATVSYDKTGQGWGQGDIYYACDARRGNCTDFHAVFIGYCRAVGIPARFSIGFPLPAQRGTGEIKGYHCWAEFYTPESGWVPVDASEAAKDPTRREYFFGTHDENRVEFTRGRDLTLEPAQHGAPLNYFIYPYAEMDGQPFTGLLNQFRYADAPAAPGSPR